MPSCTKNASKLQSNALSETLKTAKPPTTAALGDARLPFHKQQGFNPQACSMI